ncbi:MAG: phosphotransferase [Chitinophagaceae bacterium]
MSNVLFDENDKGICVIDLDTVMPGYFISDVGDMMRTYLSL